MDIVVIENVKKMLARRGYNDIKYTDIEPQIIAKNTETSDIINVFFVQYVKVTINVIKSIISASTSTHIIIVNSFPLTPDAKQTLNSMLSSSSIQSEDRLFKFELFSEEEMSYDIISIVPQHRKINNINGSKLPIILSTDIVSRYYDFRPGDIIEITEENGVLAYRRCV
jgi:DNA-directed RNA polymerase subunit H (RpoH/RPB5)